jgi:DNA polymerase I
MLSKYIELLKEIQQEKDSVDSVNINSRIMLIDGTNFYLRCFMANPSLNENGEHLGGSLGFLRSLGSYIKTFKPTRVIITFDGKGGSQKRRDIFSDYKGNRLNPKSFNRAEIFEDAEDEAKSMQHQFMRLVQYLRCLPVLVVSLDHIEADDMVSYLTTSVLPKVSNNIILVSDDKDFLQLINDKVSVYRPVEKKMYKLPEMKERFGVPAENYHLYKVFIGDSSDNIPGIPGIGPKTAEKLAILQENRIVSLQEFLDYCESNTDNKVYKKILDHKDAVIRNYKLMQLHDVDISGAHKLFLQDKFRDSVSTINKNEFLQILTLDKGYTYIKDPVAFLNYFSQLNLFALGTNNNS